MEPTVIGIIGCGNISDAYLKGAARSALVRVKAVADLFPEAARAKAKEYSVGAMTPDALLADRDVEIVINLTVPLAHRNIQVVDDLKVTERLKLFLLNLPHTCLAEHWLAEGRGKDETVREIVADPAIRTWLDTLYDEELLPAFAAAGIAEAPTYSATVMGRPEAGGVAWFAHVGGFLAGIALLFLLKPRRKARL